MQFSSVFPLEGKACMSPVRRGGEGSGSERVRIRDWSSIRNDRALRRTCSGARGAASSAQCVLTSDAGPDTLVVRTSFRRNYADPNEVAAVILGGGTGTQLFPLTSTRATPAKKEAPAGEKPEPVRTHLRNMIIVPEMIGSIIGSQGSSHSSEGSQGVLMPGCPSYLGPLLCLIG